MHSFPCSYLAPKASVAASGWPRSRTGYPVIVLRLHPDLSGFTARRRDVYTCVHREFIFWSIDVLDTLLDRVTDGLHSTAPKVRSLTVLMYKQTVYDSGGSGNNGNTNKQAVTAQYGLNKDVDDGDERINGSTCTLWVYPAKKHGFPCLLSSHGNAGYGR